MVSPAARHPRSVGQAAWRFLIVGGSNTLVTTAVLIGLSYVMPGWLAYTIAFALGLAYSTLFASRWVFAKDGSRRAAALYALAYVVIFLIGLIVVAVVRAYDLPAYANALSVLVTAPLGFVAGRIIFQRREENANE